MRYIRSLFVFALLTPLFVSAQTVSVAATPPMGWNSWNYFGESVNDQDIRDAADALVSTGMRDAGYVYVNIDGGWQGERDAQRVLHPNKKFPDMKSLADYVHTKGLKFGIYSTPGPTDCAGSEGSLNHEEQDARMFADWGVDYLKYDLCSYGAIMLQVAPGDIDKQMTMMHMAYEKMHKALIETHRPIMYSLCQYGWDTVWAWGPEVGASLWRTTGDLGANYDRITEVGFSQAGLSKFAAPGHWNDPDILEVGNGKLTLNENQTHMTLWAMLAAPLLAGNNLSKMNPEIIGILENKEVIAIDQDPLGIQGDRVYAEGPIEIWAKALKDGSKAIAIFNRGEMRSSKYPVYLHLKELGISEPVKAYNIWANKDLGEIIDGYKLEPETHGVILLKVSQLRK